MVNALDNFSLEGKVCIITGGGGLLGARHAEAITEAGGSVVLWDINLEAALAVAESIGAKVWAARVDITDKDAVAQALDDAIGRHGGVHILINNAANDPKVEAGSDPAWSRFENMALQTWALDLDVGLTGAFLCAQAVGSHMAKTGGGVILNIASDLSLIAPDQRLYRRDGLADDRQPVKPVSYSVVKHGLIGLTRYLAAYWAEQGVRCNAISPGGIENAQDEDFVSRLSELIPMGRMARKDEYKSAIVFLCSQASAYMTGHNLVMDGGRSVL